MQPGEIIRAWRHTRRMSQLGLATEADISARHLSFVETGRAGIGAGTVLTLARVLEMPLLETNRLLIAAGHAPPIFRGGTVRRRDGPGPKDCGHDPEKP